MKDEEGNIGIGEWAEEVVADIRRFADHWNAQRESGDAAYPERMGKGDWDEQFNFFCTSNAPAEARAARRRRPDVGTGSEET